MKLGGITWWRGNYGSTLQAYSLARAVNSFEGVEYEIIDQFGAIDSAEGVLGRIRGKSPTTLIRKAWWEFKFSGMRERRAAVQRFIDRNLPVSSRSYNENSIAKANDEYDGFICGSDQIWNPDCAGLKPLYWLSFAKPGKKKIAYAPSVGVEALDNEQIDFVRKMTESFSSLSCRELEGSRLISEVTGRECVNVADPTILVKREEWLDDIGVRSNADKPYVFAYILRGTEEQRCQIERFAKKHDLKVITFPYLEPEFSVPYDKKFGDERVFDADPFSFLAYILGAQYVFTDSFHCCLFSLMFHKQYVLLEKRGKAQSSRLVNLQKSLEVKSRLAKAESDIDVVLNQEIDWETVDERMADMRQKSLSYLKSAIGVSR